MHVDSCGGDGGGGWFDGRGKQIVRLQQHVNQGALATAEFSHNGEGELVLLQVAGRVQKVR